MHGYEGMLFGIMFEDFLSRRYLQQLRDSVLSLYEVIEVSPCQRKLPLPITCPIILNALF